MQLLENTAPELSDLTPEIARPAANNAEYTLPITSPELGDVLLKNMIPLDESLPDGRRVLVCDVLFPDGSDLCPAIMVYDTRHQTFAPEIHLLGDRVDQTDIL